MAFWGIEVKPGKPFTHKFDDLRGRLHVSMASLGMGKATARSVLQCNVGNKSPVFLCNLYPEKTESLQLNLEFEEVEEVIFSVIGPRSIHLSGYYLGSGRFRSTNEESESYGEDIADTDTQRSDNSEEDEYEGSFIDDEDPKVFPPSPVSNGEEESLDDEEPQNGKGNRRRRLRKKYQLVESEDEEHSPKKNILNGSSAAPVLDSDDEDNFPIFSCLKNRTTKKAKQVGEEKADKRTDETSKKNTGTDHDTESKGTTDDIFLAGQPISQTDLPNDQLPFEVGLINNGIPKKRKEWSAEGKSLESDSAYCDSVLNEDKKQQGKEKVDNNIQYLNAEDGQMQKMANDNPAEMPDVSSLPSPKVDQENDERPKKKRKEHKNEKKTFDVISDNQMNDVNENKDLQDEAKVAGIGQDQSIRNEIDQKSAHDKHFDQSEEKKVKKKKKKKKKQNGKAQGNEEVVNTDEPLLSVEENNTSLIGIESMNTEAKTSQVRSIRTLQNGLVVEELESSKPDGKVAVSGKKISIHYVGKLKKNGEVVDSNVGCDPFKFRLGAGKVMEGFDVGLEGMRVGEKRRLTVPPLMGFGSKGDGKNVPPNSWLVYEVELVKVR